MNWFKNMKMKMKLILAFSIVIALTLVVTILGVWALSSTDNTYSDALSYAAVRNVRYVDAELEMMSMRRATWTFPVYIGNSEQLTKSYNEIKAARDELVRLIRVVESNLNEDPEVSAADRATRTRQFEGVISETNDYYDNYVTPLYNMAIQGASVDQMLELMGRAAGVAGTVSDTLSDLADAAQESLDNTNEAASASANSVTILLVVIGIVAVLAAFLIALYVAGVISTPIKKLVEAATMIANGNPNISIDTNALDETGELARAFREVVIIVTGIVDDLSSLSHSLTVVGDTDYRADAEKYKGEYKKVISAVNNLVNDETTDLLSVHDIMLKISNGDFDFNLKQMPGKKAVINQTFDALKANLQGVSGDISRLVIAATEGKLSTRSDASKYKGDWAKVISDLNKLLEEIISPINEASEVLGHLSAGKFDIKVEGNYQGDFLTIKKSVNNTLSNVSGYIEEISSVLSGMANNDLDQVVRRDYVGKYADIKESLNKIIANFNSVVSDIFSASDQVASGAKQISESSMTLAQGATEQASSIEELNATITTINENTQLNAGNAKEAEGLSVGSKESAASGSENMSQMLSSMDGIKESSNKISKIIKVIDDIAFQTNLLALNAAVEAARAGEHGKGFAVVAEEVRTLAGRSQTAARETAELIEESIDKVNEGSEIAERTSEALSAIVSSVEKVANIITSISTASNEQMDAIGQVMIGVNQITGVVQSNSATSEETASSSQEMSSQAEVLKGLVGMFNLKK